VIVGMSDVPVFGERLPGSNYIRRPSVYAMLQDTRGNWAVVRTLFGCYLPGGGAEPGETPEQTVQREGLEECGFVLKVGRVLGSAVQFVYSTEERQFFEKICTFVDAEMIETVAPTEPNHELLWVTLEEALKLLTHESHCWALQNLAGELV
jgi:8-oxo-dGTP diphosphatase